MTLRLLLVVDWLWHHGGSQLTQPWVHREGSWADRLHLWVYKNICSRVA
jgi:hypothetical protein